MPWGSSRRVAVTLPPCTVEPPSRAERLAGERMRRAHTRSTVLRRVTLRRGGSEYEGGPALSCRESGAAMTPYRVAVGVGVGVPVWEDSGVADAVGAGLGAALDAVAFEVAAVGSVST